MSEPRIKLLAVCNVTIPVLTEALRDKNFPNTAIQEVVRAEVALRKLQIKLDYAHRS